MTPVRIIMTGITGVKVSLLEASREIDPRRITLLRGMAGASA